MTSRRNRPWQEIQWAKPSAGPVRPLATREVGPPVTRLPADSLTALMEIYGEPQVPGATALQEAVVLLHAAAEVEHGLLVEYLYTAWSMGSDPNATKIAEIAIQEMCHFLTVQNLLLFAGAQPSVQRQDEDPSPQLDPFAFTLRPFSQTVLEEFLLTEMPLVENMTQDQRRVMDPIIAKRNQQRSVIHPVGLIYAKLYWLFQSDDLPTAEWRAIATMGFSPGRHIAAFPGAGTAATYQAEPVAESVWRGSYARGGIFENISTRTAALHTVFEIAKQGEGFPGDSGEPSHFQTFLDIYNNTDFQKLPANNWPTDPFVSNQPDADPDREANRITNPVAAALAAVLDLRYRIALTSIRAALSRDRTNSTDLPTRTKYVGWAFDEMKPFLLGGSSALARQPLKSSPSGGHMVAAPTLNLDGFGLPDDSAALEQALLDLHRQAAIAINAVLAQQIDLSTKSILRKMQQADELRYPTLQA
jgi:hypothetical protein